MSLHIARDVTRPEEAHYHVARCSCGWKEGFLDKDQAKSALFAHVAMSNAKQNQVGESE